jgi:catechol 2,3-dioxygenase-like lactoylglutathione lyase family enzyme
MKPYITIITLGVDDLDRSLTFYRDGLGLPTQGIIGKEFEYGAVVFFELQHGVKLALWPRTSIAHDTHLPLQAPSATDLTLAHNVSSKEEVDQVMQQAKAAGATILKAAQETFYGGYAGYFQDPDQHVWEIAWNPQFLPD